MPIDEGRFTIKNFRVQTDFLANPLMFPYLQRGRNEIIYEDDSGDARDVSIEHEWREYPDYQPLPPPDKPLSPEDQSVSRESILPFRWPAVPGAEAYHLLVTTQPDTVLPYRNAYDVIVNANEYSVPFTGMFQPDRAYYWRVRARDGNGVWSCWSPVWTFTWRGPCVPVDLRTVTREDEVVLQWAANPKGERPHHYKVYGSDIKGFSVSDATHTIVSLGEVESNLVCETKETSCTIISPDPRLPNMNETFYRVVAVDAHGVESGCSDYAELPHPSILAILPQRGLVNQPYRYKAACLYSLGDLQYRYDSPNGFWDREEISYELIDAPEWLAIDADGVISGIPEKAGKYTMRVEAVDGDGNGDGQAFTLEVVSDK